jgi:hypothetical protein
MPLTAAEFRRMALSLPETEEGSHMDHPDFRVANKIFASLSGPRQKGKQGGDHPWGMVKLTPQQQKELVRSEPEMFEPFNGAWGRSGCTKVHLAEAGTRVVRGAITSAWRNTAPKRLVQEFDEQ